MGNEEWSDPTRLIPPYAITGGRVRPAMQSGELELETLITTTAPYAAPPPGLTPEQQSIVAMCRAMQSIAEVSAYLDVPFGVARVLVGDLAVGGLVTLHRPATAGASPDLIMLERVLQGLKAL